MAHLSLTDPTVRQLIAIAGSHAAQARVLGSQQSDPVTLNRYVTENVTAAAFAEAAAIVTGVDGEVIDRLVLAARDRNLPPAPAYECAYGCGYGCDTPEDINAHYDAEHRDTILP